MDRTIGRATAAAVVAFVFFAAASPTAGYPGAFFPTQSLGNKGSDVVAIQRLLRGRGSSVAVTGRFNAATRDAVTAFQRRAGLAVDGIVGPATWGRLIRTLRLGSSGEAVLALKYQLNAKRGAGLSTLSASFGTETRSAVIAFQRHMGLTADGIVGPATWRNLIWHYQRPRFGFSMCKYNDPPENWGTAAAVGQLTLAAVNTYGAIGKKVAVGDLSNEHGGDTPEHESHEVGLDVDVRPMVRGGASSACTAHVNYWDPAYDRAGTRTLIKKIRAAAAGHVKLIFFNDPVLIREGLVTWQARHNEHLHIRYCEQVHPNSLYDC